MTLTKKKKRILFIALPAAGVLIAAGAVLWLGLGRQPERPFAITYSQTTGEAMSCSLQQGLPEEENLWERDLPLYTFHPGPEWEQTQNAAQQANQFSLIHQDVYQGEGSTALTFTQQFAVEGDTVPVGQEVFFGDTQMIFSQQPETTQELGYRTQIYWVHENTLLSLTCANVPEMHLNEMLQLVGQVDYQTLRQPVYSDLTLERGYMRQIQLSETVFSSDSQPCRSQGNPQIPEDAAMAQLTLLPEGFAEMTSYQAANNASQSPNFMTLGYYNQNNNQQQILFFCWLGSNQFNASGNQSGFAMLSNAPEEEILDATVKGNPAFVYTDGEHGYIGWIDGCRTLEIDVMYPISQEDLIALAETVE